MLELRTTSVRNRFTGRDFDFIASILAEGEQRAPLSKLWLDPDARRELLDLTAVFRGLLDSPAALQVSPRFYFYVLSRHTFRKHGIENAGLAEYVAGVMTKRITASPQDFLNDAASGYTRVGHFSSLIAEASGRMKCHLQMAAGEQFLMLTGMYPGFLKKRHQQEGDADLAFYEGFAQKAFRAAARSGHLHGLGNQETIKGVAAAFPEIRQSLNQMVEELVFLGD